MIYQTHNSVGQNYLECLHYKDFFFVAHMHRHPELIYVEDGEIIIQTDNRTETVRTGEYALILPNRIHAYQTPVYSSVYVCIFSEDFVPHFARETRGKRATTSRFLCRDTVTEFVRREFLVTDRIPELYTVKASLYALLGEYLKQTEFSAAGSKDMQLLDQIVRYIDEHYTDNISLKSMAQDLGYEQHYLSRYFHSYIPMNFSQFVNWYRVDAATELLRNTDLSVTEIAARSGFQSLRTFNRVYLNLTGVTPSGHLKWKE
jgi:AraC-like DNA-binding protein